MKSAETDTTIKKVSSSFSPVGKQGQKILVSGKQMAMRLWEHESAVGEKEETKRPYETVGFVLDGKAKLHIDGQVIELTRGDSWLVPKEVTHHYEILEDFSAIEATAPPAHVVS